jgi:hypothetical protein
MQKMEKRKKKTHLGESLNVLGERERERERERGITRPPATSSK